MTSSAPVKTIIIKPKGIPNPPNIMLVLACGPAPPAADLAGHQRAEAEEQATQHGQEEQLEMAVLRLLLGARDELLEDLGVGELSPTRKRHGHAAGLDAGHDGGLGGRL